MEKLIGNNICCKVFFLRHIVPPIPILFHQSWIINRSNLTLICLFNCKICLDLLSINALSPSSMDSGYSGSLNNMSPTNDNIMYEIQIQQGHVNAMTPISIQTTSSPINTNVLSPASSETSSASSVHYTNLNGKQ